MELQSGKKIYAKNGVIYGRKLDLPQIRGLGTTVFNLMQQYKDIIGQIDAVTGRKDSYGQMRKRCVRTALTMRDKGVKAGDIVSTCTENHLDSLTPTIASAFLGAIPANLHPELSLTETGQLMEKVRPKMIFVCPTAVGLIENALIQANHNAEIVVFGPWKKHLTFEAFLEPRPREEENFAPVEIENVMDTALIVFSSGTTTLPKAICITHMGLIGIREGKLYGGEDRAVHLNFSPPFWLTSMMYFLQSLYYKTTRLVAPSLDFSQLWNLIIENKVTSVFLSPSHLITWCKLGRPKEAASSQLRWFITGGAPITGEQIKHAFSVTKAKCEQIYGQTELAGWALTYGEDKEVLETHPEHLGRPSNGYAYKVVNPDTDEPLGPYEEGELRTATPFKMAGYYKDDSSDAWDSAGFFKTGDIVYHDDNFNFFYVNRIKNRIVYRSLTVSPGLLEKVLMAHPSVDRAIVVGIPHPEDEDHPVGIVTLLKPFADRVTADEIRRYVDERVSDFEKLRGGVKIVPSIPHTLSGKMAIKLLKDMVLEGKI